MKHVHFNLKGYLAGFQRWPLARVRESGSLRRSGARRQPAAPQGPAQEATVPTSAATAVQTACDDLPGTLPSAVLSPCEVWWRLEDLWLRLGQHAEVSLQEDGSACSLVITGGGLEAKAELGLLCAHAADPEGYAWRIGDRKGSFVQWIDRQGDDLVCQLSPCWCIESWPEGPEVAAMVQGFLAGLRLKQRQAPRWQAAA